MKITDFAHRLATAERGKVQVSIAQILQLLAIINKKTHGILYKVIGLLPK